MIATETTETAEFDYEAPKPRVREGQLYILDGRIEKANRRLAKAGIAERFSYTATDRQLVEERDEITRQVTARYHTVEVELNVPTLGYKGWTFVATLSFEQAGTIVRTVPGQECSYRPTDKACDHCGTVRDRTETFVVRNDETGEYQQLGRNCLELFFGLKPSVWIFEQDFGLGNSDDEIYGGGGGSRVVEVERVENIVAAALAVTGGGAGYVSKAQSEWKGVATSAETWNVLYERPVGRGSEERKAELAAYYQAAQGYLADGTVAKVIEAAKAIEGASEYAENIRILAASEYVKVKNLGYVASFVSVYHRALAKAAEVKAQEAARSARTNEWIGQVGDKKVVTEGVITNLRKIEGDYGTTLLIEWLTADGHTCKWFTSKWYAWSENGTTGLGVDSTPIEIGTAIVVTGTIKKHDDYRGLKSTVFTRCTLALA